jgi:hypothetical protein
MGLLSTVADIVRDLLIFVVVMTALLIVLIIVVSRMPDDNLLKRILTALSYRLGATAAAGAIAIPIEPIPGIDALYDIAVPLALIWYWYTFFRDFVGPTAARSTGGGRSYFAPTGSLKSSILPRALSVTARTS